MLLENLGRYKLSTTKAAVTSYAGVPLVLGTARSLGVEAAVNALGVKERDRGYEPAENIMALMGMLASGGVALDDERMLSGDQGMRKLLGKMPAANTQGEFLRRFNGAMVYRLGEVELETALKVIEAAGLKQVTLDVDAFFVETQKANAAMNHDGKVGDCPMMVSCAELKMPMAGILRPGNASPMANITGLLDRVMERLEGYRIRARSDSAGYQAGVVGVCERHGAEFTITARKDEAVMKTIHAIPRKAWRRYESAVYPGRKTEIAETVHAFEEKSLRAYRLIALRWAKAERELWDKDPYEYHAVLTNMEWMAPLVLQYHRARQDASENTNKEVNATGLSKLPCGERMANAAFFQIVLLTATVVTALKYLVLPEEWRCLTISTLRYRLIRLAGIVRERARSLWLKIPEAYPFRIEFEEARYRVIGIGSEIASTG